MGVLRSASEQARFQVSSECGCDGIDMIGVDGSSPGRCRHKEQQPSIETLMTLLWATYVIERENRNKDRHRRQTEEIKLGEYPEQLLRAADCDNKIRIKRVEEKSSASSCRRSWAFEPPHERSSERGSEWGN